MIIVIPPLSLSSSSSSSTSSSSSPPGTCTTSPSTCRGMRRTYALTSPLIWATTCPCKWSWSWLWWWWHPQWGFPTGMGNSVSMWVIIIMMMMKMVSMILTPPLYPSSSRYNATLGHKVNHSFEPNSEFILFSAHPILGTLRQILFETNTFWDKYFLRQIHLAISDK